MNADGRERALAHLREIFEEKVPFNRFLGMRFDVSPEGLPRLKLSARDELVGNYVRGNLHGGVISSMLDVVGGLVAFFSLFEKANWEELDHNLSRFGNMGTIDLRVDYLRPGFGEEFTASGFVLRTGRKVAVTRMEFHNEQGSLIAVGTGAYVVA